MFGEPLLSLHYFDLEIVDEQWLIVQDVKFRVGRCGRGHPTKSQPKDESGLLGDFRAYW
jgi:hypothetical protein